MNLSKFDCLKFLLRKAFFFLLYLLHSVLTSKAQEISPLLLNYTSENGLPSSEVHYMLQGKDGRIWFATDRGLACYNGYEFKSYGVKDGLSEISLLKLAEDSRGRIWMATFSGRLFYLEKEAIHGIACNDELVRLTKQSTVIEIAIDSLDNIYCSIGFAGIVKINKKQELKMVYSLEERKAVQYNVHEVFKNRWLGIEQRVANDYLNDFYFSINGKLIPWKISWKEEHRFGVFTGTDDTLIFMGRKICRYNKTELTETFDAGGRITFIRQYDNKIWVGTRDGVLCLDRVNASASYEKYLKGLTVTCMEKDKEGGYWFTTVESGVTYMPMKAVCNITYDDPLRKFALAITSSDKEVFVGFVGGGVIRMENGAVQWMFKPEILENKRWVNSLYWDKPNDRLLVCGPDTRHYLNSTGRHFYKSKATIYENTSSTVNGQGLFSNICKTQDGELYNLGIKLMTKVGLDSIYFVKYFGYRVSCITELEKGKFLIGNNEGVFVYDLKKDTTYSFRKELDGVRVDDLDRLGDKILIATQGSGLIVIQNGQQFSVGEKEGLISSQINTLYVDSQNVWCATNKGLSRVRFESVKGEYSIVNITKKQGLLEDEVKEVSVCKDTVFVVLKHGISYFHKRTIFENSIAPPVSITTFRVNNELCALDSELQFPHTSTSVSISYLGLSYKSGGDIKYKYVLEGGGRTYEGETKDRSVDFFYLEPSGYKFKVKAMNNSGIWSESEAAINFVILPAWWQKGWVKGTAILGFIGLTFLFYKSRVSRLRKGFETDQRIANMQLTALRAQMNPHFIFNVMNSIRHFYKNNEPDQADKYLTSFSKLIRFSLDHSDVQEISLDEELRVLKIYAELEMQVLEQDIDFSIHCDPEIECDNVKLPTLILQPFVENSFKHGMSNLDGKGKIEVRVRQEITGIQIEILDNGKGIKQTRADKVSHSESRRSMGNNITVSRIQAYNAAFNKKIQVAIENIHDQDSTQHGTRVILSGF